MLFFVVFLSYLLAQETNPEIVLQPRRGLRHARTRETTRCESRRDGAYAHDRALEQPRNLTIVSRSQSNDQPRLDLIEHETRDARRRRREDEERQLVKIIAWGRRSHASEE